MPRPNHRVGAGELNSALANELVRFVAEFTGRGATKSRAFVHGDVVVCVLEDGATKAERRLVEAGKADLVRAGRGALQWAMEEELVQTVERLTGRSVRCFLSGTDKAGDASVEVFLLEPDDAELVRR